MFKDEFHLFVDFGRTGRDVMHGNFSRLYVRNESEIVIHIITGRVWKE